MFFASEGKVVYLKSDKLTFPHAFSTRIGGVSTCEHTKSMNMAHGKGDDYSVVEENYRILFSAAGMPSERASADQIHSKKIFYADKPGFYGEGDGFYTDKAGVSLAVKAADCLPILLEDSKNIVIGAVHSGWKGSAMGIAAECAVKMCSVGAEMKRIKVAIGPSARACCYVIQPDFVKTVADVMGKDRELVAAYTVERDGRLYLSLQELVRDSLIEVGILPENIDICEKCTICSGNLFYSHRAMGDKRGTMCAAISIKG